MKAYKINEKLRVKLTHRFHAGKIGYFRSFSNQGTNVVLSEEPVLVSSLFSTLFVVSSDDVESVDNNDGQEAQQETRNQKSVIDAILPVDCSKCNDTGELDFGFYKRSCVCKL